MTFYRTYIDKQAYYQQNREHILQLHKEWRDAHPQPKIMQRSESFFCIVCKMNYPVKKLDKHKTSVMHIKELADYNRLHAGNNHG